MARELKRHRYFGQWQDESETSNMCFVVMPYRRKWSRRTYSTIKMAMGVDGVHCLRADSDTGHVIIEGIAQATRSANLIIADTTIRSPNVYYEIGIAHAMEKKVALISQSTANIPFDLTHLRHIKYKPTTAGLEKLKQDLRDRLRDWHIVSDFRPDLASPRQTGANASFLGQWEGAWTGDLPGSLPHTLIVHKIDSRRADITYRWGDSPDSHPWRDGEGRKMRAGSRRDFAQCVDNKLFIDWPGPIKISYESSKRGLIGKRSDRAGKFIAVMKRSRYGLSDRSG